MMARLCSKHSGHNSKIVPCNRWTKTEQLAYLRASLQKEAGQVLCDYGTEVTNSLKKLTKSDSAERIQLINTESKFVTDEGRLVSLCRVCKTLHRKEYKPPR